MGKPNGTILFVQDTKIVVNTYQEAVQDMAEDDDQSNLVEDMELLPSKKYAGIWDGYDLPDIIGAMLSIH
jgi:hypothetical protein